MFESIGDPHHQNRLDAIPYQANLFVCMFVLLCIVGKELTVERWRIGHGEYLNGRNVILVEMFLLSVVSCCVRFQHIIINDSNQRSRTAEGEMDADK